MKGEKCVRRKLEIDGENYYLVIGKGFLHITCPRENDSSMSKERTALERLCQEVNLVREEMNENN